MMEEVSIPLSLIYDEPAADWESEALPMGNGILGAMIFGGVDSDKIQINEETIWSGGPGANQEYNTGANSFPVKEVHNSLQEIREQLQNMTADFTKNRAAYMDESGEIITQDYTDFIQEEAFLNKLNLLKGDKTYFGSYQTLGNILITNPSNCKSSTYTAYGRTLDLNKAIVTLSYKIDEVTYHREYFLNNPSNVLVVRLTASKAGMITRDISMESVQPQKRIWVLEQSLRIMMRGFSSDQMEHGLKFAQMLQVVTEGGRVTKKDDQTLAIENATSAILIMSAGTNYQVDSDITNYYFSIEDPMVKVRNCVEAAVLKGYDALYEEHVVDYGRLFNRVSLDLGLTEAPDKKTDDLLKDYKVLNTTTEDRYLEVLFYQYGRYLLIASSRENSRLPANLQGIWAEGLTPPWGADYHTNVNLQMNYWMAEQTNLPECHIPVIDYIESLVKKGEVAKAKYYCKQDNAKVRGWCIHHENNVWGNTSPGEYTTGFYFPAAAAWMCQDIWETYTYNCDKEFLHNKFHIMLTAALFWVDSLWIDNRDGSLVANPSYSPEHGAYSLGCTSDQAIIWELFEMVQKAGVILGLDELPEVIEVKNAQKKLYMPSIGLSGQVAEWKDETTLEVTNYDKHRHQNHLFILHPGTYVIKGRSEKDDMYLQAARTTLETRGDGGTGWSKAWKINMWARLGDGDRAKKLLEEQITFSTLKNLFDNHPPFQIDGNYGATAGITEMLLQSQGDEIVPLPALPGDWAKGEITGLKARGNFVVGIKWVEGHVSKLFITSNSGNECVVKYSKISEALLLNDKTSKQIIPEVIKEDIISFATTAGETYSFTTKRS